MVKCFTWWPEWALLKQKPTLWLWLCLSFA